MFGFMMPCGVNKLVLSKMNFGGMGTAMMKDIMKKQNVMSLPDLLRQARELGVKFTACEMESARKNIQVRFTNRNVMPH